MHRLLWLGILTSISLYGDTFAMLLEKAIANSNVLQTAQTRAVSTQLQGEIQTRLENPQLELEISEFHGLNTEHGSRVGISQDILLPSYKADLQTLSHSKVAVEKQSFSLQKADFSYRFALLYLNYKEVVAQRKLLQKEQKIANNILNMVVKQYKQGVISDSEYLQVKLERNRTQTEIKAQKLRVLQHKNRLLLYAKLPQSTTVETKHHFTQTTRRMEHPLLKVLEKKQQMAQSSYDVATHLVDKIAVFAERENEPDQQIYRLGLSFPLPVFHHKSQEKQLATIELNNHNINVQSQRKTLHLKIANIQTELTALTALKKSYIKNANEQKKLLSIYQNGYKIAQNSLRKLQESKQAVIRVEQQILQTNTMIEKNIININYLKGVYSE